MDQLDDYRNGDYTEREKAVIRMAEMMTLKSDSVLDEETQVEMSRHFSESETDFLCLRDVRRYSKMSLIFKQSKVL